jgi:hypothetical protein
MVVAGRLLARKPENSHPASGEDLGMVVADRFLGTSQIPFLTKPDDLPTFGGARHAVCIRHRRPHFRFAWCRGRLSTAEFQQHGGPI